ncbi:MAG: YkgJ family cysteine cluster protein [Thermodesulfobacteriota bacterium]|nr:YkgJ family cysteine cluster protein [Thermodesulfobacteriota bacterium]
MPQLSFQNKALNCPLPDGHFIEKKGFDFKFAPALCRTCKGFCCRGEPGDIWISPREIEAVCAFLKINIIDSFDIYFDRVDNWISIRDAFSGGEYRFLDHKGRCSIYPVRPKQCRTFPFWESFKYRKKEDLAHQCPGIVFL